MKKGDALDPANYRPIASLPILCKLFSRMILDRVGQTLDSHQSPDQAGFRKGFSCDDDLFVVRELAGKAEEFNLPLWVVAIDFQKAFDSFTHPSLWRALSNQGVPAIYINVLQRLYQDQVGTIEAGAESRKFKILRGSRQGDPISPALFNAVLEDVMRACKSKWQSKGWGWAVSPSDCNLTNLRFADDLLLLARSLYQAQEMLSDIITEAERVGLLVHFGKTTILHNSRGQNIRQQHVEVAGNKVKILPSYDAADYLGSKLRLTHRMEVEVNFRMARAWAKFSTFRSELTSKSYNLYDRIRLFDSVVTPCALYGCGSWALTKTEEQHIRTTQWRMLRAILNKPRRILDPAASDTQSTSEDADQDQELEELGEDEQLERWVDWLKRTTKDATDALEKVGAEDWVTVLRKRKWHWAERVCRHSNERWTSKILHWKPEEGLRGVGHPRMRWQDELNAFSKTLPGFDEDEHAWQHLLMSPESEEALMLDFVAFCET